MTKDSKTETKTVEKAAEKPPAVEVLTPTQAAAALTTTKPTKPARAKPDAGSMVAQTSSMTLEDALHFSRQNRLQLGSVLALRDSTELDEHCAAQLEKLRALTTDESLPAETRKAVTLLVGQVAPDKPGMEEVIARWRVPRIQIAQATSTTAAKPDNAKNGDLFTSAGKRLEKPFAIIPIHFSQENLLFPQSAKAPQCTAPDATLGQPFGACLQCPHLPFGKQNGGKGDQKKTDCQNQIVVAVLAADLSQVYVIQFAKTSRSAGSALQSLAGQQPVPWMQAYLLDVEKGTGEVGNYFKYKTSPTGQNNSDDKVTVAQALCDLYAAERYRFLGEWYRGAAQAPALAAAAEGEFKGDKLDAGLAGEMEPLDLGENGAPTTPAAGASVRSAAKPM